MKLCLGNTVSPAICLSIMVAIILNKDQTSGNIARSDYDDTAITKSSVANGLKVYFFRSC